MTSLFKAILLVLATCVCCFVGHMFQRSRCFYTAEPYERAFYDGDAGKMLRYARDYVRYDRYTESGASMYFQNACELAGDWGSALFWAERSEDQTQALWTRPRIYFKAGAKRKAFADYCAAIQEMKPDGICSKEDATFIVKKVTVYESGISPRRRLSPFWNYSDFMEFMEREFAAEGSPDEFQNAMSLFRSIRVDQAEWDAALEKRINEISSSDRRKKLRVQIQRMHDDFLIRQEKYRNQRVEEEPVIGQVSAFENVAEDSSISRFLRSGLNGYGVKGELCVIFAFIASFWYARHSSRKDFREEFRPFVGILVGIVVAAVVSCTDAARLDDGLVRYDLCFRPLFGAIGGLGGALLWLILRKNRSFGGVHSESGSSESIDVNSTVIGLLTTRFTDNVGR